MNKPHDETITAGNGRNREQKGPETVLSKISHDEMFVVMRVGNGLNYESCAVYSRTRCSHSFLRVEPDAQHLFVLVHAAVLDSRPSAPQLLFNESKLVTAVTDLPNVLIL